VFELEIAPLVDANGVRLTGELDFATAPRLSEALVGFSSDVELCLDLTELAVVDSAGLHAILALARARDDRSLVLLNPSSAIMRSFEIAGIDQHPGIEIQQAR
jgi:anti-sigma B factor antagonist